MVAARRGALLTLVASITLFAQDLGQSPGEDQEQEDPRHPHLPRIPNPDEDKKLPNGKSQKDEIAKQDHQQALKESEDLLSMAQQLHDELKKAGNYVVPVAAVKRTEEIEKLARRIRGRLKG